MSKTRKKLGIPSIVELSQRSIAFETWKSRPKLADVTNNLHPKHITKTTIYSKSQVKLVKIGGPYGQR